MKPQNLLVMMSDEHNPKMLGCAGHPLVQTPNLDGLAARGTRFSAAYTTCPICVPARASFATGRYVHDTGYWDNAIAYDGEVESWGHRLQIAGVRVDSIGKLHYRNPSDPTGFDVQHIPMHLKDGVGMVQHSIRGQWPDFTPPPPPEGQKAGGIVLSAGVGESEYTRYDRKIAELAADWIQTAASGPSPWVLFVSFVTPHYPLMAPEEFLSLYSVDEMPEPKLTGNGYVPHPWLDRLMRRQAGRDVNREQHQLALAAYLALCTFMDAQVGRVLQALDDTGLRDQTRILYTSDHGENAGARGMWGKSVHYEESGSVPMILTGDGVPEGKVSSTPVMLVDAFPSILEAVGVPLPEPSPDDGALPGRSLFELANASDEEPDRIAFSEYHAAGSPSGSFMIRQGRYKYIHYVGFEPELFDLDADPEELHNLAQETSHADIVQRFERELRVIVDPDEADRRAKVDQKALVERLGGPEAVMQNLATTKNYTPVPDEVVAKF